MGFVYLITCLVNNKHYVGQTSKYPVEIRWKEHKYRASVLIRANANDPSVNMDSAYFKAANSITLYRSMALHGIENFTFEILEELPNSELNDAEMQYITEFNCRLPLGYNATSGGDYNYNHSPESIQKMIEVKYVNLDNTRHPYLQTLPPRTTFSEKLQAVILVGHPLCDYKMFSLITYGNIESIQEAVINFVNDLERAGIKHVREKKENDLADYPGLKATKKGYKLEKYINKKKYVAGFESKKYTREENKIHAKEYYDINIRPLIPN